jgi:inosine-uridine nucleoside N-ribohydrolase
MNNSKKINIILDTDIGGDCDDIGALTLLHELSKRIEIKFLAMTGCTSCKYIAGTIDAVNQYYKHTDIPVGIYGKPGFIEDEIYSKYITEHFYNRYTPPMKAPDAVQIMKNALFTAEDSGVTFVSIGPLNNLADLIASPEGYNLVKTKVRILISMAGALDPEIRECNIVADIPAAIQVFNKWPTPIVLSPYETGDPIITGCNFNLFPPDHPMPVAYKIFNKGNINKGRNSWDLTAVWYAVMGEIPFFELSKSCTVTVTEKGCTVASQISGGRFRFLLNKMQPKEIAKSIDAILGIQVGHS